MGFSCVRI